MSSDPAAPPAPLPSAAALVSALPPGSLLPAAQHSTPAESAEQIEARALWSRPMAAFSGPAFGNTPITNQPADPAASALFQLASGSNGAAAVSAFAPVLAPPPASFFAAPATGFFSAPAAGVGLFASPPAQSFGATFGAPAAASPFAAASGPSTMFSAPSASLFAAPAPTSTSLFAAPPPSSSFANAFGDLSTDMSFKKEKKKRKDTAAATSGSALEPLPCPMLSALSQDTGVQFYLTEHLSWLSMSALHRTCSQWRGWLDGGKLGSSMEICLSPDSFPSLQQCKWVQRFIGSLVLQPQWLGWDRHWIDICTACLRHVLASLHALPRLRDLSLELHVGIEPSADEVRACFESLAPRLESLSLILPEATDRDEVPEQTVPSQLLHALPLLTQLRSFSLLCKVSSMDSLDLSPLTLCPLLASFTFNPNLRYGWRKDQRRARKFKCAAAHLQTILQCKQLTALDMGEWNGQHDGEATLSILARTKASYAKSAAHAAAAGKASPSDCVPLRFLDLSRGTTLDSSRFALLSEFTSLEDVSPVCWDSTLSAQDWMRLTRFTSLQSITIHADAAPTEPNVHAAVPLLPNAEAAQMRAEVRAEAATLVYSFLPALLRCSSLTTVRLGFGLELSAADLTALVHALPLLSCLELRFMNVESCAPLADAPQLCSLSIDQCFGKRGAYVNWRLDLPAMRSLSSLLLHDSEEFLLIPAQVRAANAALRDRLPMLLEFKQNLRKPTQAEMKKYRA